MLMEYKTPSTNEINKILSEIHSNEDISNRNMHVLIGGGTKISIFKDRLERSVKTGNPYFAIVFFDYKRTTNGKYVYNLSSYGVIPIGSIQAANLLDNNINNGKNFAYLTIDRFSYSTSIKNVDNDVSATVADIPDIPDIPDIIPTEDLSKRLQDSRVADDENSPFAKLSKREYVAILLQHPSSGTPWIDRMIENKLNQ